MEKWGDVSRSGIEEKTVAGRGLEIQARTGKGSHPAHGTQRRRPVVLGSAQEVLQSAPLPRSPGLKCFSFYKETGGGREEEPRAQEGVPVFGNTERQSRLMVKMKVD